MSTETKTIRRSCGHSEAIVVDASTIRRLEGLREQPCLACQPTFTVERLCGHVETIERTLSDSPRRAETAAMQNCCHCQEVL